MNPRREEEPTRELGEIPNYRELGRVVTPTAVTFTFTFTLPYLTLSKVSFFFTPHGTY